MSPGTGLRFEGPGEVLRRRPSLLVGSAVLCGISLLLDGLGTPAWSWFLELGLAAWLAIAFGWRSYWSSVRGVVHANQAGLRVDDRVIVSRASIAAAFLVSPEGSVVRIVQRGARLSVDVRLESEEHARALLTALGVGIGQSITTFVARYGHPWRSAALVALSALGIGTVAVPVEQLLHHAVSALSLVALGLPLALALLLLVRTRVDVGSDGVLIRRLGEQRFVSYASMKGVFAAGGHTIVLSMREGADLRFTVGPGAERGHLRDTLVEQLEEARNAFSPDAGGPSAEALVDPGGRTPQRWLRDVRSLANARDYRETRLDEERLWRVVDDAAASAGVRAGAAVALSALDPASRARLRVAAEACAEPRLRVALTRVAEGATDAELEEALAPLLESKS